MLSHATRLYNLSYSSNLQTILPSLPANHCISSLTYNMSIIDWLNVLGMMINTTRHINCLFRNISKLTVIINLIFW